MLSVESEVVIADFLGLPLTTVKWRLHAAKNRLRLELAPGAQKALKVLKAAPSAGARRRK